MRAPIVTGVAGGVGTRTVAFALGVSAHAPGQHQPCDVLVCRTTLHSVGLVERHLAAVAERPVLLVTSDAGRIPRPVRAKLRMVEAYTEGAVHLPHVPRWREVVNPYADVSQLVWQGPEEVAKHLRRYHAALRRLIERVRPQLAGPEPGVRAAPPPGRNGAAQSHEHPSIVTGGTGNVAADGSR